VKTDLTSTKADLDKTKSDLKKVSGDLGITNGYVATQRQGYRGTQAPRRASTLLSSPEKREDDAQVGDISLQLEKSDAKKNRFNVIVLADDKRVEKKDPAR